MTHDNHSSTEGLVAKVVAYAIKQLQGPQAELFTKFINLYYQNISYEDMRERSISDLYGAVYSHWELMHHRKEGETKMRVFNPNEQEHGWQSTHTIIQIVTDDMPFLIDSIRMEIHRLGLMSHLMIYIGGVKVCRDKKNCVEDVLSYHSTHVKACTIEAPIYMEIDRQTDPKALADIQSNIARVLKDTRAAVEDWKLMKDRVSEAMAELDPARMKQDKTELDETKAFLKWLLQDHFTFLGFREYECVGKGKDMALRLIPGSGLGVLRDHTHSKMLRQYSELPRKAREIALSEDKILIIAKTNTMSTVHRPAYTDYIGVKRFNEKGELIGERRFIGLYTSIAYAGDPRAIPFLRDKVRDVLKKTKLVPSSHAGKDFLHILANLPRDDLFHGTVDELYKLGMGILHLQERRRIRLFMRKDAYGRFMSCLVYVPRENFTTDLVNRMQDVLVRAFNGLDVSYTTYFSESVLARIHYVIRINPRKHIDYDLKEIESTLIEIGESWEGKFRERVLDYFGEERGNELFNRYRYAFPTAYREVFLPRQAVYDVEHIEKLTEKDVLEMSFYRPLGVAKDVIRFKLFRLDFTVPLSDALPMLENMGLRVIGEQPYQITFKDERRVWVNDFNMRYAREATFDVEEVKNIFQEAFQKIWLGEAEDDPLNRLVLEAELNWREIVILRAYSRYFRQIDFAFSQEYIAETLVENTIIARLLIKLFKCLFDPTITNDERQQAKDIEEKIEKALDEVAILDEDRILRRYLILIRATVRTNYFQLDDDGNPRLYLSFKLNPKEISDLPLPLPKYEMFVYSPRFEGIHLRAAKVARGGIRWSDRREDYRTEVLGLMKAQQVKNAVIIPAGAKGGFVTKNLPLDSSREEIMQEGIFCYQGFIKGLLDLTDNLIEGDIIHPSNTVCYDDGDPYFVVAADKGTATFSDIANNISLERHYWMGDAFASGGSTGYDHKKMGITARGAWVSAEEHFRNLGINISESTITVVGIGDMSGDVFGNGMLMSPHIKLVAAFNHQHIFLDPNPSPQKSYDERLRLFNLVRSTWDDYDRSLISSGGGIYLRSSKAIRISPEVKELLDIKKDVLVPNELIRTILKSPVDLIWNGGIGTYVKATNESHTEVGDRTNDGVRVDGIELRARVVCEGGNLGLTQLGRIEYDLNGGKINTDFIDNSAGVDCSDHEVNIKILLNDIVATGDMTEKQRNALLSSMTDEVAKLVLKDNYNQNQAITLASYLSYGDAGLYIRYLDALEQMGKVDRDLEFLPSDKTLLKRKADGIGLTRPELCVLFAYTKIILEDSIKKSDLVRDPYLSKFVCNAFPTPLEKRFEKQMHSHYLVDEIIATELTNRLVSEMGITFTYQMADETGAPIDMIVRAYVSVTKIFKMAELLADIRSLDYKVRTQVQHEMVVDAVRLIRRGVRWMLRNRRTNIDIAETIEHFSGHVYAIFDRLHKLLLGEDKKAVDKHQKRLVEQDVPPDIASKIASTTAIYHALNIVEAASTQNVEVFRVAKIYFMLADRLDLFWFRERINAYPVDTHWAVLARFAYKGDLDWIQRELTIRVLLDTSARSIPGKISEWLMNREDLTKRWQSILAQLHSTDVEEFAILFVAIRELLDLAESEKSVGRWRKK